MDETITAEEPLSEVVKVRLTARQRFRYEQAAAHEGISLSAYLRNQLLKADSVTDELRALRALIVDANERAGQTQLLSCVMESILIMRSIAAPGQVRTVHSTLEQMGIQPIVAK